MTGEMLLVFESMLENLASQLIFLEEELRLVVPRTGLRKDIDLT